MPEYQYQAMDIKGRPHNGRADAEDLSTFYRELKERKQFCIKVREIGAKKAFIFNEKPIRTKELSIFCRQFSTMLNAGISVIKCLDILYQQTVNKRMKSAILGIYEAVQRGDSLSKAMQAQKSAFPLLLLHMIEAGEESGSLDSVMERMSDQYEKDYKLDNKVRQALIYPLVLSVVAVGVVIFLLTFVLPIFVSQFAQMGGSLPMNTQILLNISTAITNYWYLFLIVIAGLVITCRAFLKNPAVRLWWDKRKLRIPLFGKLALVVESSRFSRTLASLFSSGMPIIQALEITSQVMTNRYIQENIRTVSEEVRQGVSLSESVRKRKLFPIMLCSMISIGEESGNMTDILIKTSAFYDEESEAAIQRMVSLIEPIMIVALAVVIGFIIVSVVTPVFGLYNKISAGSTGGM